MRNLQFFFRNPFRSPSFGLTRLTTFASHNLLQMQENNVGGIYDARIAATEAAYNAVHAAFSDDETKFGGRKGAVLAKRAFRKALPAAIGKIHLALAVKYGINAPELNRFFPMGRSYFHRCRDVEMENELDALVIALTKYQTELPPELLSQAQELRSHWQTLYAARSAAMGNKSATKDAKRNAMANLQRELFLNLLMHVQQHPDEPDQLKRFMQQSLLTRHHLRK